MNKEKIRELIETKYKERYEDNECMFSMFVDCILEADVIDEDLVLDVVSDITRIAKSNHAAFDVANQILETLGVEVVAASE